MVYIFSPDTDILAIAWRMSISYLKIHLYAYLLVHIGLEILLLLLDMNAAARLQVYMHLLDAMSPVNLMGLEHTSGGKRFPQAIRM